MNTDNRDLEKKNLLSMNSLEINTIISETDHIAISHAYSSFSNFEIVSFYYILIHENRRKVWSSVPKVKEVIARFERKYPFLIISKPVLFVMEYEILSTIMNYYMAHLKSYCKDFIGVCDPIGKFIGVVYISDLISVYRHKQDSQIGQIVTRGFCISLSNIPRQYIEIHETVVYDVHQVTVAMDNRILCAVSIDYVLREHLIVKNVKGEDYALIIRANVVRASVLFLGSMLSTVFSLLLSKKLQFPENMIYSLIFIRCINDYLILMATDDEFDIFDFAKYSIAYISISMCIIFFVLYSMYECFYFALRQSLSLCVVCITTALLTIPRYIIENNYILLFNLIIPELTTVGIMYFLSKSWALN